MTATLRSITYRWIMPSILAAAGSCGNLVAADLTVGNLTAQGTVHAQDVHTAHLLVQANWWGDTVFNADYRLMPLGDLRQYIQQNHHLPGVPDERAVLKDGIAVDDMLARHMVKIEELTLHVLAQDLAIRRLEAVTMKLAEQLAVATGQAAGDLPRASVQGR